MLAARKKELLEDGIPTDTEHAMVAKSGARAGLPAAAAARRKSATRRAPAKGFSPRGSKRKSSAGR